MWTRKGWRHFSVLICLCYCTCNISCYESSSEIYSMEIKISLSLSFHYYMKYIYFCSSLSCSPDLVILGEYERVCHRILALQTKISIANKMGWRVWPIDSQRHLSVSKLFSLKSKSNPAVKSVTATTGGADWLRRCLFTTTNYCFGKNGHLCSRGIGGFTPQVVVWCWKSQRA